MTVLRLPLTFVWFDRLNYS